MDIKDIKTKAKEELESIENIDEWKKLFKKYLGKKSEIAQVFVSLKNLSQEERKEKAKQINQLKKDLSLLFQEKKEKISAGLKNIVKDRRKIDVTMPGQKIEKGTLHPLTQVIDRVENIFTSLGFEIAFGPEIEEEYYNFDALNIPKNHPARDMWDTFWIHQDKTKENKKEKLLLRTHTSPGQIRYMEKHNPPLRIIIPGRTFRFEATDASHEINFYQVEGLMVDKNISVANFKAIIEKFFQLFFNKDIKIRIRPSYFPFTEPSFEIDISCLVCYGKGCSVCSQRGWLEVAGAGMVHPKIFEAVKLNPQEYQGFAFGIGLDRLAMMKYKIDDVRLLFDNDLRFLEQF